MRTSSRRSRELRAELRLESVAGLGDELPIALGVHEGAPIALPEPLHLVLQVKEDSEIAR